MTNVEQRLQQLEASTKHLERSQRRYRLATVGLLCLVVAGVSMGQMSKIKISDKYGKVTEENGVITCNGLRVLNFNGTLAANIEGNIFGGRMRVYHSADKPGSEIWGTEISTNKIEVTQKETGIIGLQLGVFDKDDNGDGGGYIIAINQDKKAGLEIWAKEQGGRLSVYNRTGERIVTLKPDEYGNGVVGAYNRKGKGRTLKPQ
jgi:hypothetical protein